MGRSKRGCPQSRERRCPFPFLASPAPAPVCTFFRCAQRRRCGLWSRSASVAIVTLPSPADEERRGGAAAIAQGAIEGWGAHTDAIPSSSRKLGATGFLSIVNHDAHVLPVVVPIALSVETKLMATISRSKSQARTISSWILLGIASTSSSLYALFDISFPQPDFTEPIAIMEWNLKDI
jgi:hypothetical protein